MKVRALDDATIGRVSHGPEIVKRVILDRGDVPTLTNLSQAVLRPGDVARGHVHPDMWEVFLVTSGRGRIEVDGEIVSLSPGSCVVVEPGEHHELGNDGDTDLVVTYFGVAPHS